MRLSLSSAAAPDAALADLWAACARRGLIALELVEGHGHGVAAGFDVRRAEAVGAAARNAGVEICGISRATLRSEHVEAAARLAAALQAPLVVPSEGLAYDLRDAARVFAEHGAILLLAHGSDPSAVEMLERRLSIIPDGSSLGLAWELRPERDDPAQIGGVLAAAGPHLRYVRLHGGGPEAAQQTGRGVGAVMARLALARYAGPLVLTPSDARYHYVWRAWLGRAGGWGCGSKQSDPSLIALNRETSTAGDHL